MILHEIPSQAVDHPKHYNSHESGIECIDVVEGMPFNIGNAVKYCWRCDHKGRDIEDLEKAVWYLQREVARRKRLRMSERWSDHQKPPSENYA